MSTTSGWSKPEEEPDAGPLDEDGPKLEKAEELSESTTRKRGRRVKGARSPGYKLEETKSSPSLLLAPLC